MHDFTIAVGNTFDPSNQASFNPTTHATCATVNGTLPQGGNLDVICDPPLEGRYVTVHMHGVTSGQMQLFEVVVCDHPGKIKQNTKCSFFRFYVVYLTRFYF